MVVIRPSSLWLDNGMCVVWRQTRRAVVEPTRTDDGNRNCIIVDKLLLGPASASAVIQVGIPFSPPSAALHFNWTGMHCPGCGQLASWLMSMGGRAGDIVLKSKRGCLRIWSERSMVWWDVQEGDKLVSVTIGDRMYMVVGVSMLELRRLLESLEGSQVCIANNPLMVHCSPCP